MGRGSEGHAGGSERRQGQPRMHETLFEKLAEEHDEAARAVKQRRAGSRFRYRRRRRAAHSLRPAQDAHFHASFLAALWFALMAIGVSSPIGTIAFGSDTEGDRISVRTAVEAGFCTGSNLLRLVFNILRICSTTLDLNAAYPGHHANAGICTYASNLSRSWVISNPTCPRAQRSSDTLQWHLATRPSLPMARQLQPAPPIASNRPPAHPDRTGSSRLSARLRPAAPPACRPNCPGRMAWTRQLLGRTAHRLRTAKPCHAGFHGTLQKYLKKKNPILGCNNAFEEPGGYVRTSASRTAPALFRSFETSSGPSSRAPSRTSPGASSVQQQIAPPLARAGCRTAIRGHHA